MQISADLVWTLVSFILTLMVFSYLFGDNAIFRFVSALFVGVTAGYFAVIILFQVILPKLVVPLAAGSLITLVPLLFSGLLILKLSSKLSRFGNIPMAYLVGVGAAVAIGGAVIGTLFGQSRGIFGGFAPQPGAPLSTSILKILEASLMLLGTLATLAYFQFGARKREKTGPRRGAINAVLAWIGQIFIAVTLGSVFAGVMTAAVTALIERSDFVLQAFRVLFQ